SGSMPARPPRSEVPRPKRGEGGSVSWGRKGRRPPACEPRRCPDRAARSFAKNPDAWRPFGSTVPVRRHSIAGRERERERAARGEAARRMASGLRRGLRVSQERRARAHARGGRGDPPMSSMHVLLFDEETILGRATALMLGARGAIVTTATTIDELVAL